MGLKDKTPGERLILGGVPGTVVSVDHAGIVFHWDEPQQLARGGISTRRWYLDWMKVQAYLKAIKIVPTNVRSEPLEPVSEVLH